MKYHDINQKYKAPFLHTPSGVESPPASCSQGAFLVYPCHTPTNGVSTPQTFHNLLYNLNKGGSYA